MKSRLKFIACAAAMALCTCTFANDADRGGDDVRPWFPIGLSIITPPVQLPSPSHAVFGAMVNLGYGQVTDMVLLDVGLVNNVTRNMVGLEVGPVNIAGSVFGAQVGVVNFADDLHGIQLGVLNFSSNGGAIVFPIFNLGF